MEILYTNQNQKNCYNSTAVQPVFQGKNLKQLKQDIIEFKEAFFDRRLDKKSDACKFFGSKSPKNIQKHLGNHLILAEYKSKQGNIITPLIGKYINIDKHDWGETIKNELNKHNTIKNLLDKKAGIMNIHSRFLGPPGQRGNHTIGLVVNPEDKKLYILDSLPQGYGIVKRYQKQLHNVFAEELAKTVPQGEKPYEIIFSSKLQELLTNIYTCDNWTHANIDAVQNALKKGVKITTQEELNHVLPNDINKILREQQLFVNTYKNRVLTY